MRVLIYGAGAVGSYIGGHLAQAGHDVTLLGREPLVQAVRANGLILHLVSGEAQIKAIHAVASLHDAVSNETTYDWIAFTMKAYDTKAAITELRSRLAEPPPIACFQNGLGNEEALASAFGAERVVAATLTTPVSIMTPGIVVEEKRRGAAIASDSPAVGSIRDSFYASELSLKVVRDSKTLKWSKLLLNIMGNATAAILDMTPGDIFGNGKLFEIERDALREALAIMRLQGIRAVNLPGAPAGLLSWLAQRVPAEVLRHTLRNQVAKGRGEKMPSLLSALHAGHRRTEVAWLNGAVAQAARELDRLAPVNHALALIVSDIAAGRVPWDAYRNKPEMLLASVRVAKGMVSHNPGAKTP